MNNLRDNISSHTFLKDFELVWNSDFSGNRGLHKFECYCLYSFIRTYKPRRIVEMSPDEGFSTFVMISAILDEKYGEDMDFFRSYDLKYKFCKEAEEKIQGADFFNFFEGDASKNISLKKGELDFFFIDSDHSRSFAEWYSNFLDSSKYFFIHDIDPSEEYHKKFRPDDQNFYCGGEPIVIYNFLRGLGFEYSGDRVSYTTEFYPASQIGEYNSRWDHKNINFKEKIFWSALEQMDLRYSDNLPDETFRIYKSSSSNEYFFGSSQSLFFETIK
jgi:hypothetical protein